MAEHQLISIWSTLTPLLRDYPSFRLAGLRLFHTFADAPRDIPTQWAEINQLPIPGLHDTKIFYGATCQTDLPRGTAVTVNTVLPGPTRSEGIVEFLEKISSIPNPTPQQAEKEFFERHRSTSLLKRLIESSEIASLVTFLASPLSSATNGAALRAEGGILTSIV
jgi:hypothetical protein